MKKLSFGLILLVSCAKVTPPIEFRTTGLIESQPVNVPVFTSLEYQKKNADKSGKYDNVQMLGKADRTVPTANITAPTSGATVSGAITITATASDNVAVVSTSSYIDDVLVSDDNVSPYSYNWNTSLNANGSHVVKVTARDAAGNTTSVTKTVTVNNVSVYQLAMPPVADQGQEGSCVSFSVGYYTRSGEQYYSTSASSYSNSVNVFSPEFLFDKTKTSPDCSGSALITALNFARDSGICKYQTMPYSAVNGCVDQSTPAQSTEAAGFKFTSYNALFATDITAIKSMVLAKHPVMTPVSIDANFYYAGPGYIWNSYSGFYNGHIVTICGFDDSKNAFLAVNSFGTNWGSAGYIWIDYQFLSTVCYQAYVMSL